jgi:hypothetical protein
MWTHLDHDCLAEIVLAFVAREVDVNIIPVLAVLVALYVFAELSPRTFWSFAVEFSSFRRQGTATGGRR